MSDTLNTTSNDTTEEEGAPQAPDSDHRVSAVEVDDGQRESFLRARGLPKVPAPGEEDNATQGTWMDEHLRERIHTEPQAAHLPALPSADLQSTVESLSNPSKGTVVGEGNVDSTGQDAVEPRRDGDCDGKETGVTSRANITDVPEDTGNEAETAQSDKGETKRKAEAGAADGEPTGRITRGRSRTAERQSQEAEAGPTGTHDAGGGESLGGEENGHGQQDGHAVPATVYRPRQQRLNIARVPVSLGMVEINRRTRARGAMIITGAISSQLLSDMIAMAQGEALRRLCEWQDQMGHASSNVYLATTVLLGPDKLKGDARGVMDQVKMELGAHGIEVRTIMCVASTGHGGIETPHFDTPHQEQEEAHMGVLAVLPGTYILLYVGYEGAEKGERLEEVHIEPGEILYIPTDQPYAGGPYRDFMAYWQFYDVDQTEVVPEYVYPGDKMGSRE